jgi:hypothetical protein
VLPQLALRGQAIEVLYGGNLRDTAGQPAHAATFIRKRLIVLDERLPGDSKEHLRVLLHELLHFVWVRAGNARRLRWEELLRKEWRSRARGECGWSAEWRKRRLRRTDIDYRTRAWREYCCESFCDTGAWIFGGGKEELTIGDSHCRRRQAWFAQYFGHRDLPV